MDKVAIYCRLSDEDKNKMSKFDESESIQNQKNLLMKYAIEKGWDIYKIYSDDDYSGLDSDRPEFNQMIKEAQEKKFNIILCKHQSRFTRDMELVEKYLHNKFIEWGIRFITVVDGVDTLDKNNKKSRQINGLVNEWYCEDISESIRTVFKNKQQNGQFIGSFATYGYLKDKVNKNRLIIDEEAAKVVRKIFDLYLAGNGTQHIAYILNEKNIPNPTKYKQEQGLKYKNASLKDDYGLWNKTTIKRILKNEMYIGNMVQGKYKKVNYKSKKVIHIGRDEWIVVEGTHEPIIDTKIFNIVQSRLKSNLRSLGEGKIHIFANKVKCMDCGSTMNKTNNGTGNTYLRCKLYSIGINKGLCTSHSIRFDYLEEIVEKKVREYINALCDDENRMGLKLMQEQEMADRIDLVKNELSKISRDIEEKSNIIKSLYIDKVKGLIDDNQFNELNSSFQNEKKDLIETQKVTQDKLVELEKRNCDLDNYIAIVKKYKNFDELTNTMVNELIDYIEVGDKDKNSGKQIIKIHWMF